MGRVSDDAHGTLPTQDRDGHPATRKTPVGGRSVQKVASYLYGRVEIVHAVENRVSQTSLPYSRFLVPPPLCLSSERAEEWRDLGNWGKRRGAGGNLCPSAGAMSTPSVEARVSLQPRCKENPRRQRGFTHLWCSSGQPGARGLSGPRAPNCLTRQPGAFGIGFEITPSKVRTSWAAG